MTTDPTPGPQQCYRCRSNRVIQGYGGPSDSGDFVLHAEDQRKGWFRLPMGYLNFSGERSLCLDCGLVTASVEVARIEKMVCKYASDQLLARLGLTRL